MYDNENYELVLSLGHFYLNTRWVRDDTTSNMVLANENGELVIAVLLETNSYDAPIIDMGEEFPLN